MRAGHIAVSHRERAIVWAGYLENPVDDDQYWNSSEVDMNEILLFRLVQIKRLLLHSW